jgi:oxygen-independent coproporphyrinogen-3 oxidase
MAGIYIHIPFCKKACHYCNFHFSTTFESYRSRMIDAIVKEIEQRAFELNHQNIQSIYFGGGTPSLLSKTEFYLIYHTILQYFTIEANPEITLEANPDDLTDDYLQMLSTTPINRLSIGIQSFFDEDLQYMNRAHNSTQALQSLSKALELGFEVSCDLIYGTPSLSNTQWQENLKILTDLKVGHISAYALTVEPTTALNSLIQRKKMVAPDETVAARQMEILMQHLSVAAYEHYEISNFALPGKRAVHNSSYWKGIPYLGIGPSAHSYDGASRSWNIAENMTYIKAIENGNHYRETENLTPEDRHNEYIMTAIRTIEGIHLVYLEQQFGSKVAEEFQENIQHFIQNGWIIVSEQFYKLSQQGKLYTDYISSQLFKLS